MVLKVTVDSTDEYLWTEYLSNEHNLMGIGTRKKLQVIITKTVEIKEYIESAKITFISSALL